MKKYGVLLFATALILGGLISTRVLTREKPKRVQTVTVTPQTVRRTVECTGRVEAAESEDVFVQWPCVTGDIAVEVGQRVRKGDVLFHVDGEATMQALAGWSEAVSGELTEDDLTVCAPVDGIVMQLNVKQGDMADHQKPCAVIAPSEEVCIAVAIRERHLRDVKVGQPVEVSGVGFEKKRYTGSVNAIADSAHQQYIGSVSETVVDAVVLLDKGQSDKSLRVGLGATATVTVDTVENALLIPYECIAQGDDGEEYIYVLENDGRAHRRVVAPTAEYANGALVVSGLSAGERLVLNPEQLDGESVLVQEGE